MTYYADLSPCDYFGMDVRLVAVGWLDPAHPHAQGEVDETVVAKLVALAANPWEPASCAGHHACPFFRFSGGPATFEHDGVSVVMGASNVFVPAQDRVYVTPSLVLHYIDAHGYAPPQEFVDAVLACPQMRSMDYLKAIAKHGLRSARLGS